MEEKRSDHRKEIQRHSVSSERQCSLRVVSFRNFAWMDHHVKIVDQCITGIGVECDQSIEPGIIWFKECAYGQKFGHLVWQRKNGDRYRAGIEFISLNRLQEEYLRKQLEQVEQDKSIQDPEQVISGVIEYIEHIKKERDPAFNLI
jgi:hypothetical protein